MQSLVCIGQCDDISNLQSINSVSGKKSTDQRTMNNTVRYEEINIKDASGIKGRDGAAAVGGNSVIIKPRVIAQRMSLEFVAMAIFKDNILDKR